MKRKTTISIIVSITAIICVLTFYFINNSRNSFFEYRQISNEFIIPRICLDPKVKEDNKTILENIYEGQNDKRDLLLFHENKLIDNGKIKAYSIECTLKEYIELYSHFKCTIGNYVCYATFIEKTNDSNYGLTKVFAVFSFDLRYLEKTGRDNGLRSVNEFLSIKEGLFHIKYQSASWFSMRSMSCPSASRACLLHQTGRQEGRSK